MTIDAMCAYCNQAYTFDPTVDRFGRAVPLPVQEADTNGKPAAPFVHFPPCPNCGNRNKVPHPPAGA